MKLILQSQRDIDRQLPLLFAPSESCGLEIYVQESKAFQEKTWLPLGNIRADVKFPERDESEDFLVRGFVWHIVSPEALEEGLKKCIDSKYFETNKETVQQEVQKIIHACCFRLGLLYPILDASAMSLFPLQYPTTFVVDTNAVLWGAMNFIARYCGHTARIKIPSVVCQEIDNIADRFKSHLRKANNSNQRFKCLKERHESQGAQRALLQLEFSDTEVERPLSTSDPFRVIFQPDNEPDFKGLELDKVQRSMADRLIFETARQHQRELSANHPIYMLTSDQGVARMAMIEGMKVLYFRADGTESPLGRQLPSVQYHPFQPELTATSLPCLLWELATSFQRVRIGSLNDDEPFVELTTHGTWNPDQAKEDLLWCRYNLPEYSTPPVTQSQIEGGEEPIDEVLSLPPVPKKENTNPVQEDADLEPTQEQSGTVTGLYAVSPTRLLELIYILGSKSPSSVAEALVAINLKQTSFEEYARFLLSGGFIIYHDGTITSQPKLRTLVESLQSLNRDKIAEQFLQFPAIQTFVEFVRNVADAKDWRDRFKKEVSKKNGVISGLKSLAEVAGLVFEIPHQGIFYTSETPKVEEFIVYAHNIYTALSLEEGEEYILTGRWLENLAIEYRIHPIVSRRLIQEAIDANLLSCIFEGSTPDRRFDQHTLDVLVPIDDKTTIQRFQIYRGSFLIPGRATIRIKIERQTHESI